jgi:TusA-related sulfurtransferase
MSTDIDVTETLDVKGQNCPMPVVKTKQAVDGIDAGETLEVLATDSGSMSDIAGWADTTDGVDLVDQIVDESSPETVYRHFVVKSE